jgi:hypothetical protein
MIFHTVAFRLKNPSEEKEFMAAAEKLAAIPGVIDFKCQRQIGKKNNFDLGLSMDFESAADYQNYCDHPDHVSFVQNTWIPNVEDFMEIDYEKF